MDKKTKILNAIFWGLIILSLGITFYKTIIKQDFVIINYEEAKEENEDSEKNVDSEGIIEEEI